jgi:hypothetical protein
MIFASSRLIARRFGLEPGDPGWFQFALEERQTGIFVGDCGLNILADDAVYARLRG